MSVRPILRLWIPSTSIPGTVVTMWSSVFREESGESVLTWCSLVASCGTQLSDFADAKHVIYNNTDLQQCHRARWRAKLEESWRQITLELVVQSKKSQSLLAYVSDSARDQHRRGGRVFLTFPWKWNVLTTWPIQSVISEAPFLCAREGKKGILTNCADTARLVGLAASLSCLGVWCSRHLQTCSCPMRCVCGTFQFRKTRCTVAILSTMKRRQPFR